MAEVATYRARERGYVDDHMIEAGETFTTSAPKGRWMALLDKDGNELDDPEPAPKAPSAEEVAERAQAYIDDLKAKHADELDTAVARAEGAEKARDDARAEVDDLKAKLAAFDKDGDGKPGGSKPAAK